MPGFSVFCNCKKLRINRGDNRPQLVWGYGEHIVEDRELAIELLRRPGTVHIDPKAVVESGVLSEAEVAALGYTTRVDEKGNPVLAEFHPEEVAPEVLEEKDAGIPSYNLMSTEEQDNVAEKVGAVLRSDDSAEARVNKLEKATRRKRKERGE